MSPSLAPNAASVVAADPDADVEAEVAEAETEAEAASGATGTAVEANGDVTALFLKMSSSKDQRNKHHKATKMASHENRHFESEPCSMRSRSSLNNQTVCLRQLAKKK